ncbi:LysR family transcriptional regulator [Ottowia thiooxydans]|uniref:DNA-binding transcriptional LysR family regulator n=1 Tax=Ottowia thiooxydans TaxID=219182 RepID=A0ABV2QDX8_9BURK
MDELMSLKVFLEVARRRSFARTADHFGLSPASVTKHVAFLERTLTARLLNRTTKQMSLTLAGEQVVELGESVVGQLETMRSRVAELSQDITGEIRIGVAPSFGSNRLTHVLAEFCRLHPDIRITLILLTHRKEETFINEGLDVGIIIGTSLKDASHKAIKLADVPQVLVASPEFAARHADLKTPADLAQVNCLVNTTKAPTGLWHFLGPSGPITQRVQGNMQSNFGYVLAESAAAGMGISMHPLYMISDELESGALVTVLPDYAPEPLQIFAIYSSRASIPLRVRTLLDFLRSWARDRPEWPIKER